MSFITVKYGANEDRLVNPNCLSSVLLHHIKRACGFDHLIENVDLASETGEVIDLASKPKEYAKKYVEGRASYILVKVIGENAALSLLSPFMTQAHLNHTDETEDSSPTYVSLLEQTGAEKIKFSVLNPTQRQRNKAKAGMREPPSRFLASGGDGDTDNPQGARATTGAGGAADGRASRRGVGGVTALKGGTKAGGPPSVGATGVGAEGRMSSAFSSTQSMDELPGVGGVKRAGKTVGDKAGRGASAGNKGKKGK
ncbi:hypothetical protein HK104_005859 [Borealophlyctis nickersoniae]|nr:hypothetical protein HK104_005859 [Borealophlyctis nickersoniae]